MFFPPAGPPSLSTCCSCCMEIDQWPGCHGYLCICNLLVSQVVTSQGYKLRLSISYKTINLPAMEEENGGVLLI